MTIRRLVPTSLVVLILVLAAAPARAQPSYNDFLRTNPKFLQSFRDAVARPAEVTVRVRCDGKDAALGLVVSADGWVLTKAHDLRGKVTCTLKDGRELEARTFQDNCSALHVMTRAHSVAPTGKLTRTQLGSCSPLERCARPGASAITRVAATQTASVIIPPGFASSGATCSVTSVKCRDRLHH